jgi:hypothetical protein
MKSTGRFTPALRHLVYHSYDECRRCGAKISKPAAALAGYDAAGSSAYVGECCKGTLKELASHIYWSWHADRRCAPEQKLWRYKGRRASRSGSPSGMSIRRPTSGMR